MIQLNAASQGVEGGGGDAWEETNLGMAWALCNP